MTQTIVVEAPGATSIAKATEDSAEALQAVGDLKQSRPEFATVPALIADTSLTYTAGQPGTVVAGQIVRTRAEGFSYEVAASGATDHHVITAGGVKLYQVSGRISSELTFKVPTDFPDILTAIERLAPLYSAGAGFRIIVLIESGYEITAPIAIRRGIYQHIWLQSEDASVPVTAALGASNVLTFDSCFAPAVDFLIDAQGNSDGIRYRLCRGEMRPGSGCINSNNRGIEVTQTHLQANLTVFDGAAAVGIRVSNSSIANFRGATAKSCGSGVAVTGDAAANFGIQGTACDFSGATLDGINVDCGIVEAVGVVAENCGRAGVNASRAANVNIRDAVLKDAGQYGILSGAASSVSADGVDVSGAGEYGLWANGGNIAAFGANASGAGINAVRAVSGAAVSVRSGNLQTAGADACFAEDGGFINARGANTTGAAGVGFKVELGGRIAARGATGSLSQEPNVETVNGIIYSDVVATVQDWTPVFVPGSGSFDAITYGEQTGKIQRISDKVFLCHFAISTSALTIGTASGVLRIGGLTLSPVSGGQTTVTIRQVRRFATSWPLINGEFVGNQVRLYVNPSSDSNIVEAQVSDLTTAAGTQNIISGSFFVTVA